jgi:SAM-dependent methyltransferase
MTQAAESPPLYMDFRREIAERFLTGKGIEIGPLHQPLELPSHANVRYVDRMGVEELRREYPELRDWALTEVDLIDDGEKLTKVEDGTQDFVVANHFLEHCEDPIGTIETHLGKLKPGGILFYAVPDKRYTFDFERPLTPLEHMVEDHEQGPEHSRTAHYEEWAKYMPEPPSEGTATPAERSEEWIANEARRLEEAAYSIHMHVWTQEEFLRLILHCRASFEDAFDIEVAARRGIEFIVLLRKRGDFPAPAPSTPPPSSGQAEIVAAGRWKSRLKRGLHSARRMLRMAEVRPRTAS